MTDSDTFPGKEYHLTVKCFRACWKAFKETEGSLETYEIQIKQSNASWMDRLKKVLNGK